MKRIKTFRLAIGLIAILVSLICFHLYAAHFIVEIKNPIISLLTESTKTKVSCAVPHEGKVSIVIKSEDGLELKACLAFSQTDTIKATIILLHGIRSSKDMFLPLMEKLTANGYNAVAMDLRAHGESEGRFCTFGFKEKQDVSTLVDYLSDEGIEDIGIWGVSLGGAVSLQALAKDKRLKFGVIQSAFSNLKQTIHDYTIQFAGFDIEYLTNDVIYRAGKLAGFNPDEIMPSEFCKNITQPIFMAHGNLDHRIGIEHGLENFDNLKSYDKSFEIVEGAGHGNVLHVGGDAYFKKILKFLDDHCNG